ncbi:hypothetical protein [Actinomadura miaoliensis]|uniref:DUF3592 domain-containing protein n=1 Tax=Actinomadura miaoliensis TaxID=430685 RepID=A0ABP7VUP1_9ACTN
MGLARSALLRGGLLLGGTLLGLVLSSAVHLWWGTTGSVLLTVIAMIGNATALGFVYASGRSFRFANVPLICGMLALFLLYMVGAIAVRDIALTLVGADAEAVVDRTWTTSHRGSETQHCTLRHTDGTPIRRELESNCEGHDRGDVIPVVLDPEERFAPVAGPKSDLSALGELQAMAGAGLVLLVSVAIGSVPARHAPAPRTSNRGAPTSGAP